MNKKIRPLLFGSTFILLATLLFGCSTSQPKCDQPLDDEVIKGLLISPEENNGVKPGEILQLELAVIECCTFYETINACASWELESGAGASITPNGELTVSSEAAHGEQLEVSANVEDGRRIVKNTIEVYREDANPLVGTWEEVSQINCESQSVVDPIKEIEEVTFKADNTFIITKQPFELYFDYAGTYTFDLAENTITLIEDRGNRSPTDFDGQGLFRLDDEGALILEDIWLGLPEEGESTPGCGHRLVKK